MRRYQCFILYKMLVLYIFIQPFEEFMTNSIAKNDEDILLLSCHQFTSLVLLSHTQKQSLYALMVYVQLKCVSRENFIFTFHLSNIFVSAALRQRYVKFIVTCAHIRRNGNFSTLLIFYFKPSESNKKINGGRFFSVAFGIPQYNRVVQ